MLGYAEDWGDVGEVWSSTVETNGSLAKSLLWGAWGGATSISDRRGIAASIRCIKDGNNVLNENSQEAVSKNIETIKTEVLEHEKSLISNVDAKLSKRLSGRILIQVEEHGEAWYVNPKDNKKYYMANGDEAYNIMRYLGVGITDSNLQRIKTDKSFAKKNSGKIFLQVESHGEAYYIDISGNAHYLKNGTEAYNIMRNLGLGILNNDLRKIDIKTIKNTKK